MRNSETRPTRVFVGRKETPGSEAGNQDGKPREKVIITGQYFRVPEVKTQRGTHFGMTRDSRTAYRGGERATLFSYGSNSSEPLIIDMGTYEPQTGTVEVFQKLGEDCRTGKERPGVLPYRALVFWTATRTIFVRAYISEAECDPVWKTKLVQRDIVLPGMTVESLKNIG